jgi:flavin reductase (DIM6/NTAB) family NADH-FMN oxidoreductase RutF
MTVSMEPAFELRSFRRALGHFPTGVCVVTSQVERARVGMTVSSFNSLSLEPPLVLFSIDGKGAGLPLWERAEGYAINVLAENQKDLSDRFAKSGSNKWEGTTYADGLFGAPVLPGVTSSPITMPDRHDATWSGDRPRNPAWSSAHASSARRR